MNTVKSYAYQLNNICNFDSNKYSQNAMSIEEERMLKQAIKNSLLESKNLITNHHPLTTTSTTHDDEVSI
jgi:hypothetical protein